MTSTWSASRVAMAVALSVWAAAFWFIIASDRISFYMAARTAWLVPVGAVTLTAAALGMLTTARVAHSEPLSKLQLRNLAVLVLPAVLLLAMPPLTLGSYAAGRRSATTAGGRVAATEADIGTGDLALLDIFALTYNDNLHLLASRAGTTSSFVGFVSRSAGAAADEFNLNRFAISCCPGDAVLISLRVVGVPPGAFEADDWVRVTGKIYPVGGSVVVDATDIEKVRRPKRPYLS